jgi:transposase InsO family protein
MEAKINGVAALIRDIQRMKAQEIEQKYYKKHGELEEKIKKAEEYQKLQKQMEELEKQERKLRKDTDKLTENLGGVWEFREKADARLKEEFIKVRIEVMGKEIEDVKDILDMAIGKTGVEHVHVVQRPRLLSDNGACFISHELKKYLESHEIRHIRTKTYHRRCGGS